MGMVPNSVRSGDETRGPPASVRIERNCRPGPPISISQMIRQFHLCETARRVLMGWLPFHVLLALRGWRSLVEANASKMGVDCSYWSTNHKTAQDLAERM